MFLLFLAALVISLALTGAMIKLSRRWNFLDHPSARKLHATATPLGGGIAIFLAVIVPVLAAVAVAAAFVSEHPSFLTPDLAKHFSGIISPKITRELVIVLFGGLIMLFAGLIDDIRGLKPAEKLIYQVIVAAALAVTGVRVSIFVEVPWVGGVVTVIWIVGMTNAFNLLDNMDGLCASVAGVISVIFFVAAAQTGQLFIAAFLAVLAGALAGFLFHNRPKARIFMGDAGSLFTGYLLSVLTVLFTFYGKEGTVAGGGVNRFYPFIVPLVIFAVPIFDTLSVIYIRRKEGRPIWQADKNHFSHRLLNLGMSQGEALATVALTTFCTGISAVLLYPGSGSAASDFVRAGVVAAQAVSVLAIIVLIERALRRKDAATGQKK